MRGPVGRWTSTTITMFTSHSMCFSLTLLAIRRLLQPFLLTRFKATKKESKGGTTRERRPGLARESLLPAVHERKGHHCERNQIHPTISRRCRRGQRRYR